MKHFMLRAVCFTMLLAGCRSAREVKIIPSSCGLSPLYVTDEFTDADRKRYADFLRYMTAYSGQQLWGYAPEKQAEIRAQFQRLYSPETSPAFVCYLSNRTNATYLVYVEAQQNPAVPDEVHVKTYIISTNAPCVLRAQEFSAGWRTCIDSFSVDRSYHEEFGDLLRINIAAGIPMNASKGQLYLALLEQDPEQDMRGWEHEPELVLIRMAGDAGQIGFSCYGQDHKHLTRGPVPSFSYLARNKDDWKDLIHTRDRVRLLAALFFLGGSHGDTRYEEGGISPEVLQQFERDGTFFELRHHKSAWISEAANAIWEAWRTANKASQAFGAANAPQPER